MLVLAVIAGAFSVYLKNYILIVVAQTMCLLQRQFWLRLCKVDSCTAQTQHHRAWKRVVVTVWQQK